MKTLLTFLLLAFSVSTSQGQWLTHTTGLPATAQIQEVSAVDANVVWAATIHLNSVPPAIVRTTNGGNTWNVIPLTNIIPSGFFLGTVKAIDANTAWFTAGNSGGTVPQNRIYKTVDGGLTWNYQHVPFNGSYLNVLHFFDANHGFTFGNFSNGGFEIFTTSNGGTTWTTVPAANMPPFAGLSDEGSGVYAVHGNSVWVAVRGWRVYKSSDKGLTWTVSGSAMAASGGPLHFMALAFTDANNGLASYRGNLLKTTDGGATWNAVTHTGTLHKTYIRAIPGSPGVYVSAGSFYFPWHATSPVDDRGSSFTSDHGNTWISLGDSLAHTDISFLNSTTGWTGGLDGTMHKFTSSPLGRGETSLITSGFTIHPNPSTGIFTVSGNLVKTFTVEVYNLTGLKVRQQLVLPFRPGKIDLRNQPKGIYLVRILSKGQVFTTKVIVQ